ncbi:hypothetical protein JRQ81_008068 [Phrynocephalus forsythii]|uniref:EGF-like domain-containing protein n=1 Tax=Phrynocephalus forsythii TaxID=171643 RepID=A0A9Q1ASJ6_9SAUR|nr:hypothetical protein JRQ81_008068 [Phrynocephalus forsythii]
MVSPVKNPPPVVAFLCSASVLPPYPFLSPLSWLPQESPRRKWGRRGGGERTAGCLAGPLRAGRGLQEGRRAMDLWPLLLVCLQAHGAAGRPPPLDPNGRNVCRSNSHPPFLSCCPGWEQEGQECSLALCTGPDACREEEVCVRPGLCRCRPGFFGYHCMARCPDQYWGSDCKERCLCHPNGKCHPASGQCSCHPAWWGALCQSACPCGARGRCDPLTGACRCEPGWWAPDCSRPCLCNLAGSRCDSATGRCLCHPGWWGRRCTSPCHCHGSPCAQETGRCECQPGRWGAACQHPCQCLHGSCSPQNGRCTCQAGYQGQSCADPCPAGTYGPQCSHGCGHCRREEPCSPVDGACLACDPGWNGTQCTEPCPPGRYGENCSQACPRCRRGEACQPGTGVCLSCEAGLSGARCELPCPSGSFGEGCLSHCPTCYNGSCDPVSGACLCQAGYWGTSCNQTCPDGSHGPNCSESCRCLGVTCHPLSGECPWGHQNRGALLAGILAPLLCLLLLLFWCYCCYRSGATDATDRVGAAASTEGDPIFRVKHHTLGALAGLTSTWPCFSLRGYKFPRVTVSHHDGELPFSPSFLEPPSALWPSDSFSSFDTDENEAPLPAGQAPGDTELQPRHLLPTEEEPSGAFAIPRTSSLAKAKRPSVSFAEGTRFGPQSLPGSAETLGPVWKPKGPWGGWARGGSTEQPPVATDGLEQQEMVVGAAAEEDPLGPCYENVEAARGCPYKPSPRSTPRGSQKWLAGSRHVAQRVEALEAASKAHGQAPTTIYVTVGRAGASSDGPVQAVLRRLGSLQRPRGASKGEAKPRQSLEGLRKPPRRTKPSQEEGGTPEAAGPGGHAGEDTPEELREGQPALSREEEEEEEEEEEAGEIRGPEAAGGEASEETPTGEEEQEPKYENVCGRPRGSLCLPRPPSPPEAQSPLEKV